MAIADNISISAAKDVRYTGAAHGLSGAGYYAVLEFYRFLSDLSDDAVASGDDLIDITKDSPADKSFDTIINMINGYNIDDTLAEHLFGGSIIQASGDTIYDGIVNYGAIGIHIEIMQNGALITDDFWNTIPFGDTEKGLNRDVAAGISHRFLIKVRDAGADIDGKKLLGLNREFGYTFGEFPINETSRGNNTLALTHDVDLNNQTAEATVLSWTEITNTEGYRAIDVNGDATDEYYYSEWNKDIYSINQFFERMKWLTRRGSASTLYGLNGNVFRGITHEITIGTPTGTFDAVESVSWTGGTGQMLAINSVTAGTKMWIQLLTGTAPTDGLTITGSSSSATADVSVTVTERVISKPFVGASTGSAIIGAYGLGIEATDLTSADKLFDLTNTQRIPPNNVTFTLSGLVVGDVVLVAAGTAGTITIDQLSVDGAYSGAEAIFSVQEAIPGDTPSSGTVRIWNGDTFAKATYTAWSGSDFTGCSGVPACADGDNVFISYIDKTADAVSASFTGVYQSSRSLAIRVRNGGVSPIKPIDAEGTLGLSGGSATISRTSDL